MGSISSALFTFENLVNNFTTEFFKVAYHISHCLLVLPRRQLKNKKVCFQLLQSPFEDFSFTRRYLSFVHTQNACHVRSYPRKYAKLIYKKIQITHRGFFSLQKKKIVHSDHTLVMPSWSNQYFNNFRTVQQILGNSYFSKLNLQGGLGG